MYNSKKLDTHRVQGKLIFTASKNDVAFLPEHPEHAARFPWHRLCEPSMLRLFIHELEPKRKDSARGTMEYVVDVDADALEQWFVTNELPGDGRLVDAQSLK